MITAVCIRLHGQLSVRSRVHQVNCSAVHGKVGGVANGSKQLRLGGLSCRVPDRTESYENQCARQWAQGGSVVVRQPCYVNTTTVIVARCCNIASFCCLHFRFTQQTLTNPSSASHSE